MLAVKLNGPKTLQQLWILNATHIQQCSSQSFRMIRCIYSYEFFIQFYYINYDLLTLWSWALIERPLDVSSLDSFPEFHGSRRFNTEFTRALRLFLSWARPIHSTSPHPTYPRSILIVLSTHLRPGLPSGLFPLLDLIILIILWRRVQITKLLFMQFSPFSRHLFLFVPNIFLSTLFSNTLSLCSSLNI
jgi:hypothetical protein